MPTVKLHYDGWLRLPASLCRALGLSQGDRLVAELVDGALALRPLAGRPGQDRQPEAAASSAADPASETAPGSDAMPARRRPGRPRKAAVTAEPAPVAEPVAPRQPWILRKKADLPPAAPAVDEPAPSGRRPERGGEDGFPFVEHRPFRQVEVRKLGPGRGHKRP